MLYIFSEDLPGTEVSMVAVINKVQTDDEKGNISHGSKCIGKTCDANHIVICITNDH